LQFAKSLGWHFAFVANAIVVARASHLDRGPAHALAA